MTTTIEARTTGITTVTFDTAPYPETWQAVNQTWASWTAVNAANATWTAVSIA